MFTVIAILFAANAVYVAQGEPGSALLTFRVENTNAGANDLATRLQPLLVASAARRPPLLCIGTTEGPSLDGPVFEQLVFEAEVRRFVYAQPKYLVDAKALGLSPQDPTTLLKACQQMFPGPKAR